MIRFSCKSLSSFFEPNPLRSELTDLVDLLLPEALEKELTDLNSAQRNNNHDDDADDIYSTSLNWTLVSSLSNENLMSRPLSGQQRIKSISALSLSLSLLEGFLSQSEKLDYSEEFGLASTSELN